ncbi:hypothetical protein [Kocuria aegyptia]|uniref:Uncharacterized protein n=1 Tax=Kocuria aegyptia TaxID=330943 RepID=A0ABN2L327_9MICC
MSTSRRVTAASAAAVLGLFLAGCDNTGTEETPEAPAGTTAPMEDGATTEPTDGAGMGGGATDGATTGATTNSGAGTGDDATTGADGTVPEGDTGGTDTGG